MSWRLRTSLGETVIVIREREASREDATLRVQGVFARGEARSWLLGGEPQDRRAVLEMFEAVGGHQPALADASPQELQRYVLPAIEAAFDGGELLVFRVPLPYVPADLFPPEP